ncbi:uncharacterized protein APUU_22132S [Aspergillus puulaauensis]|uniref:Uncharacterized protein n=1 Tax=Aspergillus puulaauensis TaxID=1220207 RepID=A0A7R8ALI1_9EURO|nr:uncharacterized protein APUU_22132S [Aspergillus puulaauensis]BCS21700.1 hypothetical protein APUU_22132S [Aspergillus puulaauensis]
MSKPYEVLKVARRSYELGGEGISEGQRVGIGLAIMAGSILLVVAICVLAKFYILAGQRRRRRKAMCQECQPVYPAALPMHETPVEFMPEEPAPAVTHDHSYRYYCKARDAASESVARDQGLPTYDPAPAYTPHAGEAQNQGSNQTGDASRTEARRYADDAC